jgi:hypothetical protein
MELIFRSWAEITLTENHIKQLHRDLLQTAKRTRIIAAISRPNRTMLQSSMRPENRSGSCSKRPLRLILHGECLNSLPGLQTRSHRGNCILFWSLRSSWSFFSRFIHSRMAAAG